MCTAGFHSIRAFLSQKIVSPSTPQSNITKAVTVDTTTLQDENSDTCPSSAKHFYVDGIHYGRVCLLCFDEHWTTHAMAYNSTLFLKYMLELARVIYK